MKKIYVCGDSFACLDPDSSIRPWIMLLQDLLGTKYSIENLSMVCASNFLIRLQIDRAIENHADFIIMFCTSSLRRQGKLNQAGSGNMLDRFYRIGAHDNHDRDLACYSMLSLDDTCVFNQDQMASIASYHKNIGDIELDIRENQFIIESSLHRLVSSGIPFIWDQGGFENPKFGADPTRRYFVEFQKWRSDINIWNLAGRIKSHRPYFHIVDPKIHDQLSRYYRSKVSKL